MIKLHFTKIRDFGEEEAPDLRHRLLWKPPIILTYVGTLGWNLVSIDSGEICTYRGRCLC